MYQIKYKVMISYVDFDNQTYNVSYELFANDKDDASKIARELFFMSYGTYNDMKITVNPLSLNETEKISVNKTLIEVFGVVKNKFTDKNYKDFLKLFENFDGHNLVLQQNYASFWFKFMNIECKAVWENGTSYISEEEIVLHLEDKRTYVVRNNLCDVYIAY